MDHRELEGVMDAPLTFSVLRTANVARCSTWHKGFPDDGLWLGVDWSNAAGGEMGEAANVVKKLRRWDTDTVGALDPSRELLLLQLGHEIADTIIYLDLVAAFFRVPARIGTLAESIDWDIPRTEGWIGSHWSNAAIGAVGKVADAVMTWEWPENERPKLRLEAALAVTHTYLGRLAWFYSINIDTAVIGKFNFISEREGLPHRL